MGEHVHLQLSHVHVYRINTWSISTERQQQRMLSIDDDDGTTEYDPHEHAESLRHGIPDHFGITEYCKHDFSFVAVLHVVNFSVVLR